MSGRRTESGAVAVMVALLSIALFGMAALAVDLSNAFVRKRDVQRQADFGALAGGSQLGAQKSGTVPSAVVDAVRDQLNGPGNLNLVQDDADGLTPVTSADLTDGVLTNGEVKFVSDGLQVTAPQVQVNYQFAGVLGAATTSKVLAKATVGLFTPGTVMPVYAVQGCDWGSQPITDPASGDTPVIPPLAKDSDTNATAISSITLQKDGVAITEIPPNASGVAAKLAGKDFADITKVGFFRSDNLDEAAIVEQPVFTPAHGASGYSNNGSGSIEFTIPEAVTAVEKAWYIRVFSAGSITKWSSRAGAVPLRVGGAILECNSESSDGNFGALKMPRTDVPDSGWLPVNIAAGLQSPLSLTLHAGADASGKCVNGLSGAVESVKPNLLEGTNCVDTNTGLPANDATDGLVNGSNGFSGALRAASSSTVDGLGCAAQGGSGAYAILPGKNINNDVLSCFLTGGASLATIVDKTYAGGPVLHPAIYESPRFFWQPILAVEPTSGGSNRYSITGFRPAFLTDEVVSTSTVRGSTSATETNGLKIHGGQIKQIRVVFFNSAALPASDRSSKVSPYLGTGPKILRLIH